MSRCFEWESVVGRNRPWWQLLSVLDTMLRVLQTIQTVNHLDVP